jgi:hypothetical protein
MCLCERVVHVRSSAVRYSRLLSILRRRAYTIPFPVSIVYHLQSLVDDIGFDASNVLSTLIPPTKTRQRLISGDSPPCYTLWPKIRTTLRGGKSRHSVDRRRFSHFAEACKKHAGLRKAPDGNCEPASHPPTVDFSGRSPSVASSELSDASSLELFGLEARLAASPSYASSVSSSELSEEPEFFSTEERQTSPWEIL